MQDMSRASVLVVLFACTGGASSVDGGIDVGVPDTSVDASIDASIDGLRVVGWWGGLGTEPGLFIEPSSVELDSDGFVYVAGHENRFQKFTSDGELVAIYGTPGIGDGEFNHPHGLAVDRRRGDLVYVGDQENHRLQVFLPDGTFVRAWGDELFLHIHDVGIDPATGDIFVGDLEQNIVRRFTAEGEELWRVGGLGREPGFFDAIWGMSTDSSGNVYIGDTNNRRVQVLTRDGELVREWTGFGEERFNKPTGVFVDHEDVVYVCDSLDESILLFDVEGNPLERWDLPELFDFVTEPEDIVIDARGEHIYVAEVRQHRVLHLLRSRR